MSFFVPRIRQFGHGSACTIPIRSASIRSPWSAKQAAHKTGLDFGTVIPTSLAPNFVLIASPPAMSSPLMIGVRILRAALLSAIRRIKPREFFRGVCSESICQELYTKASATAKFMFYVG